MPLSQPSQRRTRRSTETVATPLESPLELHRRTTANTASSAPRRPKIERDFKGETALHRAARSGNVGMLERFLAKFENPGDAVHVKSEGVRCTALHLAAEHGHTEVVRRLLEAGGPMGLIMVDAEGCTAVEYAIAGGKSDVLRLLLAAGADLTR